MPKTGVDNLNGERDCGCSCAICRCKNTADEVITEFNAIADETARLLRVIGSMNEQIETVRRIKTLSRA